MQDIKPRCGDPAVSAETAPVNDAEYENGFADNEPSFQEYGVDPGLRYRDNADLGVKFGLKPAATAGIRACRNALIMSLLVAMETGHNGVFYSRRRNVYSRERELRPRYWTYPNVIQAVTDIESAANFFVHIRQPPRKPTKGKRQPCSSIEPGPDLLAFDTRLILSAVALRPTSRVELRNSKKQPKAFKPNPVTAHTEAFLRVYDERVDRLKISIDHPDAREVSPGLYCVSHQGEPYRVNTNVRSLVRIFNGTLTSGGRFYRGFWQNAPKFLRPHLRIDDAPVFEHDFHACHPRLIYFAAKVDWPYGEGGASDPYTLPDTQFSRPIVKMATSVLWNTRSYDEAVGAIARILPGNDFENNRKTAKTLIEAIKAHHPGITAFFHSNCGKRLQFIDSQILQRCLECLVDAGIVGLPIHDSIIVPVEHQHTLVQIMEETFATEGGRLAREQFSTLRRKTGFCSPNITMGKVGPLVPDALSGVSASGGGFVAQMAVNFEGPLQISEPAPSTLHMRQDQHAPAVTANWIEDAFHDLSKLVRARSVLSQGIIRTVLVLTGMLGHNIHDAIAEAHPRLADLAKDAPNYPAETVAKEVERYRRQRQTPIAPSSAAKLCGVTRTEATRLDLRIVRPPKRASPTEAAAKRLAKSWNAGIVPRIVDVTKAQPWIEDRLGRSRWYAQNKGPDLQYLALNAHIKRKEVDSVAEVKDGLEEVKRIRDKHCSASHLPVDDLIDKLDSALRSYQSRKQLSASKATV